MEAGYHNVTSSSTLEFKGRNKLTIEGSIQGSRISCASNTGLAFINGNDLSISNLVIENCGANHSTYYGNFNGLSAVFIFGIRNLQLLNVICDSPGSAISLINVRSNTTVDKCKLLRNSAGSGVYIYYNLRFNSSIVNYAELLITNSSVIGNSQGNTFDANSSHMIVGLSKGITFDGCVSHISIIVKGLKFSGILGKGMLVHILNSSSHNSLTVSSSTFVDNACVGVSHMYHHFIRGDHTFGGGVYIQFQNLTSFNILIVERCVFIRNTSPDKMSGKIESGGGGIEAGYYFLESDAPSSNSLFIISCDFEQNYANFGGGTLLFSSYAFRRNVNNSLYLADCLWKNNTANFGAAVDLISKISVRDHPPQGILPISVFTNCTFKINRVINGNNVGKGTFISTDMSAHFNRTTIFEHCTGSAIHMTSGFLIFERQSNVTFSNNTGSLGGGLI